MPHVALVNEISIICKLGYIDKHLNLIVFVAAAATIARFPFFNKNQF